MPCSSTNEAIFLLPADVWAPALTDAYGAPELAVNPQKQKRMVSAALGYIKFKRLHQVPCRFDVVAINTAQEKEIELIQNAFEMDRTRM